MFHSALRSGLHKMVRHLKCPKNAHQYQNIKENASAYKIENQFQVTNRLTKKMFNLKCKTFEKHCVCLFIVFYIKLTFVCHGMIFIQSFGLNLVLTESPCT